VHVGNITDGAAGITMVARTVNAGASKAADSSSNRRDFPGTTPHTKRSLTGDSPKPGKWPSESCANVGKLLAIDGIGHP